MSDLTGASREMSGEVTLEVKHIGGIETETIELEPGINVLSGPNATNRTSLLRALGSVLGGSTGRVKSSAESGRVALEMGDERYERELVRDGSRTHASGTPYSTEETLIDLFAVLLEDNEARRAVQQGDDLRDLIMRPVDTSAIESRIDELKQEKKEIADRIAHIEQQRSRLPELTERREQLQADIVEIDGNIETLNAEIRNYESDVEAAEGAADLVEELQQEREKRSQIAEELEIKQAERKAVAEDIDELESELETISVAPETDIESITTRIESLQSQRQQLDDTIASMTAIVDFNQEQLNGETSLPTLEGSSESPTAALTGEDEQEVVCWTCGTEVKQDRISEQLADIRAVIDEKRAERQQVQTELEELQDRKREMQREAERHQQLKQQISQRRQQSESHAAAVSDIESELEAVDQEIQELEEKVRQTSELRETNLVEKSERVSQFEYERGQYQQQLETVEREIEEIESLPEKERLRADKAEIQASLEDERDRITRLEKEAVNAFNDHMDELLDVLDYQNIARVWIEILKPTGSQTGIASDSVFDMHIIRESTETVYEDDIATLSESERELIGLVFALAGYLVHDVHETAPFMLLDSLEALDSARISELVSYFSEHVPYLVVALLPEDAADLSTQTINEKVMAH